MSSSLSLPRAGSSSSPDTPVPPQPLVLGIVSRDAFWRGLGIAGLFCLLTIAFTWPQTTRLGTDVINHQDSYFSIWRLAWIAHQLVADPRNLFEGNIYYPAHRTLAYSDAMLLPGLIGLPLIRAGLSPVLVMNLLNLAAIAMSGVGMYLLARRLTGSTGAAIVAGMVFAFAPYRAAHLHHLELQWAQWMPLAFWAFHRTLTDGRLRDGVLTGIFIACQLLSSIYYAMFLGLTMALVGGVLLVLNRSRVTFRSLAGLAIGALLVVGVAGPYSQPYRRNVQQLGVRSTFEVGIFSATPESYLTVTPTNRLYGGLTGTWSDTNEEKILFPGLVPVALLVVALLPPVCRTRWVYLLGLAFVVEMSFGWNGWLYRTLYEFLTPLHSLRAAARFGILVLLMLGVLAAYGAARLERWLPGRAGRLVPLVLALLLCMEYAVASPRLETLPTSPPPVYRWLARQGPTRVLELPGIGADPKYMYFSTMHWQTLINGYSGNYPPGYQEFMQLLVQFPDDESMEALRTNGVEMVIVHPSMFAPKEQPRVKAMIERLQTRADVEFVASWSDDEGEARVYRVFYGAQPPKP